MEVTVAHSARRSWPLTPRIFAAIRSKTMIAITKPALLSRPVVPNRSFQILANKTKASERAEPTAANRHHDAPTYLNANQPGTSNTIDCETTVLHAMKRIDP